MKRPTLEYSNFTPVEETVLCHTTMCHNDTIEARIIIVLKDDKGNEWEFNDVKKFRLKWKRAGDGDGKKEKK